MFINSNNRKQATATGSKTFQKWKPEIKILISKAPHVFVLRPNISRITFPLQQFMNVCFVSIEKSQIFTFFNFLASPIIICQFRGEEKATSLSSTFLRFNGIIAVLTTVSHIILPISVHFDYKLHITECVSRCTYNTQTRMGMLGRK